MLRSLRFKKLIAEKGADQLTVGDVMATHPVTLGPEAKIWDAVEIMESQGFNHIPIVQDGKLMGLLTERHVRDAVPSIILVADARARQKSLEATRVTKVWIENPRTITSQTLLRRAIPTMRRLKAGSLPVVDAGKLVGILTGGDLITALEAILSGD